MSLPDAWVYLRAREDEAMELAERTAWLIASVANIAGAKPAQTVDSVMGRRPPETPETAEEFSQALSQVAAALPDGATADHTPSVEAQIAAFRARARALAGSQE